jgi:hypothetical protein
MVSAAESGAEALARVLVMLEITVQSERDRQRLVRPGLDELGALVAGLGGPGNRFLVIQRVPDLPEHFIQTWHEDGEDYIVEYRDGGQDRQFETTLEDPAEVAATLVSWARRQERQDGWDTTLPWQLMDLGPAEPVPPLQLDEEQSRLLDERVRLAIAAGYDNRGQLSELAEDYLVTKDARPVSAAQARELVDRLWVERVAEQSGWDGETDPERVTRAFLALEAAGITARENFTCCRSCGQAEIGAAGEPGARGFVYFHSQCTDSAAAGHGLTLLYGGFDGSSETTAAVGREVVAALTEVGLPTDWDGDPGTGIEVTPLDWRKRLIG